MIQLRASVWAVGSLALSACGSSPAPSPSDPAPRPAAADTVASPATSSAGTSTPTTTLASTDEAVIAMVRAERACEDKKPECPKGAKWPSNDTWRANKDWSEKGAADPALVGLLADEDPKIREIALRYLSPSQHGKRAYGYTVDEKQAAQVVTALEKAPDSHSGFWIAISAAEISFEKTGLGPRLQTWFKKSEIHPSRALLVSYLGYGNRNHPLALEILRDAVKDPSEAVRRAAMEGYSRLAPVPEEACTAWLGALRGPTLQSIAEAAATAMTDTLSYDDAPPKTCVTSADAVVKAVEKQSLQGYMLGRLCDNEFVSADVKKSAAVLAKKRLDDTKRPSDERAVALESLARCDAAMGKAAARALANSPDEELKKAAAQTLAP